MVATFSNFPSFLSSPHTSVDLLEWHSPIKIKGVDSFWNDCWIVSIYQLFKIEFFGGGGCSLAFPVLPLNLSITIISDSLCCFHFSRSWLITFVYILTVRYMLHHYLLQLFSKLSQLWSALWVKMEQHLVSPRHNHM